MKNSREREFPGPGRHTLVLISSESRILTLKMNQPSVKGQPIQMWDIKEALNIF